MHNIPFQRLKLRNTGKRTKLWTYFLLAYPRDDSQVSSQVSRELGPEAFQHPIATQPSTENLRIRIFECIIFFSEQTQVIKMLYINYIMLLTIFDI